MPATMMVKLLVLLAALALLLASCEARQTRALLADAPGPAPIDALSPQPFSTHEQLCALLASAPANTSLLLAADPGTFSGVPETRFLLQNAAVAAGKISRSASCPAVAVGTLLGQPAIMAITGIGPAAASACTAELLSCEGGMASGFREAVWLGTSGWSPQIGGVLNADNCSRANPNTDVTRVGDICISPLGEGWCFNSSWTEQASGNPNQCFQPPAVPGPEAAFLFGNCMFSNASATSLALADELIHAAQEAKYSRRPASLAAGEELYWSAMQNGTGVEYAYDPEAPPAVRNYTQCAEVAAESFWSEHPWDAQARLFVSQLITASGVASVTQKDVIAVSAMEARGFLTAIFNHNAATDSQLPHAIVRAASDIDSTMPVEPNPDEPGVWVAQPFVEEDISVGYGFAIGTSSSAVLNMFSMRCLSEGGTESECSFKLIP